MNNNKLIKIIFFFYLFNILYLFSVNKPFSIKNDYSYEPFSEYDTTEDIIKSQSVTELNDLSTYQGRAIEIPSLLKPDDLSIIYGGELMDWTSVTGASEYNVQTAFNSNFNPLSDDDKYTSSSTTVSGNPVSDGSLAYWRVRAKVGGVWGPFSQSWRVYCGKPNYPTPTPNPLPDPVSNFRCSVQGEKIIIGFEVPMTAPNGHPVWYNLQIYRVINNGGYEKIHDVNNEKYNYMPASISDSNTTVNGTYYYYITVRTKLDYNDPYSIWSNLKSCHTSFTKPTATPIPKPDFPKLTFPADKWNTGGADIHYKWDSAPRATEYWLQIATDSGFTNLVFNKSVQNSNDVLVQGHPNDGTMYYWHVKAGNSSGWSSYSNYWYFINGPDAPPDKPFLTLPLNGSNAGGFDITLEWDRAPRANKYHVQMALDSAFTKIVVDEYIGNFSGQPITNMLDNGRVHYWRVEAGNVLGWSGFTDYWTFTNGPTGLPETPNLLLPVDGADITDPSVTLTWDMPVRTTELHIQVATDSLFTSSSLVVDESFLLRTQAILNFAMESETGFYWRLQGWNITYGYGGWSEIRHFMKIPSDLPENPVLIAPTGYQEGETLTFTWNKGERASKYNVQIATDELFTNVFYDFEVGDFAGVSGVPYFPDNGMDIYWRARAGNLLGWNSSFSEYLTFKNGPSAIPEKPILTIPANNSNVSGPSIRTEWEYTKRSAIYHYQVALDSNFTKLITDEYYNEIVTSVTLNGMPDNGIDIYWRVESGNDLGWSGFTDYWKVTNGELKTPLIPIIISPYNGDNKDGPRITFEWTAVLTASHYDLEVAYDQAFTNIVDTRYGITETTMINDKDVFPDNGVIFYWRVRAGNSAGVSNWPTPAGFINGPSDFPEASLLISPDNGINISNNQITFEWSKSNRAFTYVYQAALNPNFNPLFKNEQLSYNNLTMTFTDFPNNGEEFYWRVIAMNALGEGVSLPRTFINGYAPTPTITPTPTMTPTPIITQTPTPTMTPTPTSTIIPSPTLTLTPTPTSTVDPNLINLALNKTVKSSSYYQTYIPENAVDGDEGTVWGALSTSDPKAYLFVDLERKYQLDNVKIKWTNPHFATQYDIGVSNDLTNWIKVTVNSDGNLDEFNASSLQKKYRYVGIRCLASNGRANGYGVSELEVWGQRPDFTSLKCDLTLENGRWIPNTDEILRGINVNITGLNADNTPVPITTPFEKIRLLPPLDPNWTLADNTNDNNINRNKGGDFELYVCGPSVNSKIATFIRNPNAQTADTAYDLTSDIFDTNGEVKSNLQNEYEFAIDISDGMLYLRYTKSPTEIYTYKEFGIKAINGEVNPIRPGDDLLFRFALADYTNPPPLLPDIQGTVPEENFIAVYDKKMLWRANTYLITGVDDWNVINPWTTGNEWNKVYLGNSKLNTLNELNDGDGGITVQMSDFTNIPHYDGTDSFAVAYAYGCSDTPFEFSDEMYQQKVILNHYITNGTNGYLQNANGWTTTTAPGNGFMDAQNQKDHDYKTYVYPNPAPPDEANSTHEVNYVTINVNGTDQDFFPYLAGWALEAFFDYQNDPDPRLFLWDYIVSAGVDCIGLVQMSASYDGNNYAWDVLQQNDSLNNKYGLSLQDIEDHALWYLNDRTYPRPGDNLSWELYNVDDLVNNKIQNAKLVPGDVIYYPSTGDGEHIVIVLNVEYDANSRNVSTNNIQLIESTYGEVNNENIAKVINIQDLNDYNNKDWIIVRLKTN